MEIELPKDAEALVDQWIHGNYRGVLAVNYFSVHRKKDYWLVRGEVEIKKGVFGTEREEFSMRVDPKTGRVETG